MMLEVDIMLINEVSKVCNLTKKAIEYYIEQNLISPQILENGYRYFSEKEIGLLKKISLYRRLGLSIMEIKKILVEPNELTVVLYRKTLELEEEKIKQEILQRICKGEEIEKLEEEINNINSKSIIIKKLMDLFPSYYGKFISINFSKYLTGKIETKEQMEAFNEIIDFFDNVSDIEIPVDLQEYLDNYLLEYSSEEGISIINNIIDEKDKGMKNIDEYVKKNKEILERYNSYRKKDEFKKMPAYRLMELMKNFCASSGYYDKFIPAMRKLSPLYNEYYEQMMIANCHFIKNYSEYME